MLKHPAIPLQTYLQTCGVLQLRFSSYQPNATLPLRKEKMFCKQKRGTRNYIKLGEMEIQDQEREENISEYQQQRVASLLF